MTTEKATATTNAATATATDDASTATVGEVDSKATDSVPKDTTESVAGEPKDDLSGRDARAKGGAADDQTLDSHDLKKAVKQYQVDNQLRFKTLRKDSGTGAVTTVEAKDPARGEPAVADVGKDVANRAGKSGYAYSGKPPRFTGKSAVDEGFSAAGAVVQNGAAVVAVAVDSYTSIGGAHADAHEENAYRGRVDGYAAGYASGLHGEKPGDRKVRHKVSDPKELTYWRTYNESVTRGYDDASKLTDDERTAARAHFDREAEKAGDGRVAGEVLTTGREVKREIMRHAYAAD